MVKIFVTGDNHIGRKYDRYPEIKEKLKAYKEKMKEEVRAKNIAIKAEVEKL